MISTSGVLGYLVVKDIARVRHETCGFGPIAIKRFKQYMYDFYNIKSARATIGGTFEELF